MRKQTERSFFLPLVFLGAVLCALAVLACSVPVFEYRSEETGGCITPEGRHGIYLNKGGWQYFWACRTCGGDFNTTLFMIAFDPEAGRPNPPPYAEFLPAESELIPVTVPGPRGTSGP